MNYASSPARHDAARPAPLRIMVVDDDPFVRDVTVTALSSLGDQAVIRAYGTGAAALAEAEGFRPDLVILDVLMPVMDGRATWRELRMHLPSSTRLIFLTAAENPSERAELMELGAAGIIAKPFDPLRITDAVWELAGLVPATSVAERFDAVAHDFVDSLPATVAAIDAAWRDFAATWTFRAAEPLLGLAHKLAGSAGLFRFDGLGAAADRLEELLRAGISESAGAVRSSERPALESACAAVVAAAEAAYRL